MQGGHKIRCEIRPSQSANEPTYSPPRNPPRANQNACQGRLTKDQNSPLDCSRVYRAKRGGQWDWRGGGGHGGTGDFNKTVTHRQERLPSSTLGLFYTGIQPVFS